MNSFVSAEVELLYYSWFFGEDSFISHKAIFVDNEISEFKRTILSIPILTVGKCGWDKFDDKGFLGVINLEQEIELVDGYITYPKAIHDHVDMIDILNNNVKYLNDDSGINKIIS